MCCLQAVLANLNVMCSSEVEAQKLGAAVEQTVNQAIPSSFGPSPCALFQGRAFSLQHAQTVTNSMHK